MKSFFSIFNLKLLLLLVFQILISEYLFADQFKIIGFTKDEKDLSAINQKFRRYDDMDEICAIIKVRSDIQGLGFQASNPIIGDVVYRNGEYWVYVSGKTREISIFASGYIRLAYTFPLIIEKARVYILTLSSASGGHIISGKGSLYITSNPENTNVSIDGFPDIKKQTPCSLDNYRATKYKFNFSRQHYHSLDTIIEIEKNANKQLNINLKPAWGNLIVNTPLTDVNFEINNTKIIGGSLVLQGENEGLPAGKYPLTVSKENYQPLNLDVQIKEGQTANYNINLIPITTTVTLNSIPAGADVFIDGQNYGKTPLTIEIIIGKHQLKLSKENFLNENLNVTLYKNKTYNNEIKLRNRTKIKIISSPPGALVILNGEKYGKTPVSIEVNTGINKLELLKENYETLIKNLDIEPEKQYSFNLVRKKYTLKIISNPSQSDIIINNTNYEQTPKELNLDYGIYELNLSKKGYIGKTKRIKLDKDQTVNIKLPRQFAGLLGISYVSSKSDYSLYKIGFEIGWTYKKAKRFFTSFTYNFNRVSNITDNLPPGINKLYNSEFDSLNVNILDIDGVAEQKVNNYLIKMGVVVSQPFVFAINATAGLNVMTGYNVYIADKDYQGNNYTYINAGDKFIIDEGKFDKTSFIYGVGITIPFSNYYISADYMISEKVVNLGPEFMFGIGYSFNSPE